MGKVCAFTGKTFSRGNKITRRGKAKYLGGIGRKVTGITKRTFRPNLQRVQAVVDGKVCRVWASVKAHSFRPGGQAGQAQAVRSE